MAVVVQENTSESKAFRDVSRTLRYECYSGKSRSARRRVDVPQIKGKLIYRNFILKYFIKQNSCPVR